MRSYSHFLIGALVTSFVIANLVLFGFSDQKSAFTQVAGYTVAHTQSSLLAIWIGLVAPARRLLAIVVAGFACCTWYFMTMHQPFEPGFHWVGIWIWSARMTIVATGLIVAGALGWRLYHVSDARPAAVNVPTAHRFQFSLHQLFIWTTYLAIALIATRFALVNHTFPGFNSSFVIADSTLFALLSWIAVWGTLGKRPVLGTIILMVAAFILHEFIPHRFADFLWPEIGFVMLHAALTAACLFVFRAYGYRFGSPPPQPAV